MAEASGRASLVDAPLRAAGMPRGMEEDSRSASLPANRVGGTV
jgi:hypothetical protein